MIPEHLFAAAARGDLETIRAYFEDDSDGVARNVDDSLGDEGDDNDETLLLNCAGGDINHDRMTLAHVNLARYLLSRGASIDLRNSCGNTALMRACYCGTGAVAVLEMVELLLSAGADANAMQAGCQVLHGKPAAQTRFRSPERRRLGDRCGAREGSDLGLWGVRRREHDVVQVLFEVYGTAAGGFRAQ